MECRVLICLFPRCGTTRSVRALTLEIGLSREIFFVEMRVIGGVEGTKRGERGKLKGDDEKRERERARDRER